MDYYGFITPAIASYAPYTNTVAFLQEVASIAHKCQVPLTIHLSEIDKKE